MRTKNDIPIYLNRLVQRHSVVNGKIPVSCQEGSRKFAWEYPKDCAISPSWIIYRLVAVWVHRREASHVEDCKNSSHDLFDRFLARQSCLSNFRARSAEEAFGRVCGADIYSHERLAGRRSGIF